MADVALLGIRVDSTGAVKATTDLEKLTTTASKADVATEKLATSSANVAKAMSPVAQQSRIAAMQLSQVAQQTMASGNFIQALAIQLPDMALGFGTVGIAAGIFAGVALPLVASALMGGKADIKSYTDELDSLKSALGGLNDVAKIYSADGVQVLIDKYGELNGQVLLLVQRQTEAAKFDALRASIETITALREEMSGGFFSTDEAAIAERLGVALSVVEGGFRRTNPQVMDFKKALADVAAAKTFDRQAEAISVLLAQMEKAGMQNTEMYSQLVQNESILRQMAAAAPGASWMDSAISGLANLGEAIRKRISEALQLRETMPGGGKDDTLGQTTGTTNWSKNRLGFTLPGAELVPPEVKPSSPLGAGGGGVDPFQSRLEALQTSLQTETEIVNQWYADAQAVLADRRSQEIMGVQGHKDAMLAIEKSYQDQLAAIESQRQQTQLSDAAGFFGAMASVAQSGGGKMVKAVAVFSAAQGLINSYAAYTAMLADPAFIGRPWARFAAAASVLASGLKMVSAIRGVGGASGGSGIAISGSGSGSGGGGGKVAAQAAPQKEASKVEYIVRGIDKSAIYTGEMISQIFDGISEEAQKRGMATFRFV